MGQPQSCRETTGEWCYDAYMKRTTISLPDDVALLIERDARRRGCSVSEVTRQALLEHLGHTSGVVKPLAFAALGASGHSHTARDMEAILDEEWVSDIERDRGR